MRNRKRIRRNIRRWQWSSWGGSSISSPRTCSSWPFRIAYWSYSHTSVWTTLKSSRRLWTLLGPRSFHKRTWSNCTYSMMPRCRLTFSRSWFQVISSKGLNTKRNGMSLIIPPLRKSTAISKCRSKVLLASTSNETTKATYGKTKTTFSSSTSRSVRSS